MSIDLRVIGGRKGCSLQDLSVNQVKAVLKQDAYDFPPNTTPSLAEVKLHHSNLFGFDEVFIDTDWKYCPRLHLYGRVINFTPAGFPTRFSSWIDMFVASGRRSTQSTQYKAHWTHFLTCAKGVTKAFGGDALYFFDDQSHQTIEDQLYQGATLEEFGQAISQTTDVWPLSYLEEMAEEFVHKMPCFYLPLNSSGDSES